MNEGLGAIARWLEQERRKERVAAAVLATVALGAGVAVFLVMAFVVYGGLYIVTSVQSAWLALVALSVMAAFFARIMKAAQEPRDLRLDPMGFWMIKDVCSFGPRLMLDGLLSLRRYGGLGELNVAACARALAYLASQNSAVNWEELLQQCPDLSSPRLREQLLLLHGVLFLGEDAARITLMEPFRLRLRHMLGPEYRPGKAQGPARARPEPAAHAAAVNEPEKLSPYELLGLSPLASLREIKTAYRKRVKECHPDLFVGMDQPSRELAERWMKALNAAYSTLNPRRESPQRVPLVLWLLISLLVVAGQRSAYCQAAPAATPATYLHDISTLLRQQWPSNRTVNIVCHGHSVPAGYFKTPVVETFNAYPYLLHRGLKERFPYAVLNVIVTAIGGENAEGGAKRFEKDVLAVHPDVVTIDYALNDRALGLARAEAAWRQMIEAALQHQVKVILLTPTPDLNAHLDDPADPLNQHAEQIRRLAGEYGVGLVDSLAAFHSAIRRGKNLKSLMAQSNHPNRKGHELVARELLKWFP